MRSSAIGAALVLAIIPPASAYETIAVPTPGTIRGRIVFQGTPPPALKTAIQRDAKVCGAHVEAAPVQVGSAGGLMHAAAWLTDIEAGAAPRLDAQPKLDNVNCRFVPHVQTLEAGDTLVIRNSDPILHNTHAYVLEGEGTLFNLALPTQGKEIRKPIKKTGIQQVKCDAGHTWMNAYFLVFEHPYHAVTDASGGFTLQDVPPGKYTLRVWHATLGSRDVAVEVVAGTVTTIPAIVFAAATSR
jgi:hypothetical protein